MRIGGFQKISLIDYPGKISAVIFTQGCNFRCPFCHNVELVLPSCFSDVLSEDEVLDFLTHRVNKLQGVVITGGEPTIQPDVIAFIEKIKALGYAVKLDTNGSRPAVLHDLLQRHLIDYVAMDIKAPLDRYDEGAGVRVRKDLIEESIRLIRQSGLPHLFRTTFLKPLLIQEDIPGILAMIDGPDHFQLQPFVPQKKLLDDTLNDRPHYQEKEFESLCEQCACFHQTANR